MLREEDLEDKRTEEEKKQDSLFESFRENELQPFTFFLVFQGIIVLLFPESWLSSAPVEAFTSFVESITPIPILKAWADSSSNPNMARAAYSFILCTAPFNALFMFRAMNNLHKKYPEQVRLFIAGLVIAVLIWWTAFVQIPLHAVEIGQTQKVYYTLSPGVRVDIILDGVIGMGGGFICFIALIIYTSRFVLKLLQAKVTDSGGRR